MPITKEVILEVKYTTGQDKVTDKISLVATVVRNELIPAHIFLFKQNLDETVEFCAIASVSDLQCFPANKPDDGNPFYRLDSVELEFDTAKTMKEVLDSMRAQIARLVADYQILVCEVESEFTETYVGTEG